MPIDIDIISTLKAVSGPSSTDAYVVRGYYSIGDGGGGFFRWNAADTTADNGGTVIALTAGGTGRFNRILNDYVTVRHFGAKGDGTTNDSAAITALEAVISARVIDLAGLTHLVTAVPTGNVYVNGFFKVGSTPYQAGNDPASISDPSDTGGLETAYSGGTIPVPTVSGRSTAHLRALIASQNCRSTFARSVNIAAIYSQANGNLSANLAARQSIADCPQSLNAAAEECVVYGFRGANIASEFCRAEGSSSWNHGSDYCRASAENAGNLGSYQSTAGRGYGLNVSLTVVGGVITGYSIVNGGQGYSSADTMRANDRVNTPGVTATFTFTVDGSGTVTSITITNGGTNYSAGSTVDLRIDALGGWSANIASARSSTQQQFSGNLASDTCTTKGRESVNIASDTCTTNDENTAIIASTTGSTIASGANKSAVIAGNNCTINASGAGSVIAAGLNSNSDHAGCMVFGRRVTTALANTFIYGDNSSGSTLSSNRKFQITPAGNVTAAGTFTGSTVFTDYAEMFPNLEHGAIGTGVLVALDGRSVRPVRAGDAILGVISKTALVLAGDSQFQWAGRYLTGEFGEMLYHDIPDPDWQPLVRDPLWSPSGDQSKHDAPMVPNPEPRKLVSAPLENPGWDEQRANVARSDRPDEWSAVGLLGQVHVRVSADVAVGDHIAAADGGLGGASATPTNVRCMEIRRPFDPAKGYAVAFCLLR